MTGRREGSSFADVLESLVICFKWGVILLVAGLALSGLRVVSGDEAALVLRFGRLVGTTRADQVHGPGLLFAFPTAIDQVVNVPVGRVQEVTIGTFAQGRSTLDPIRTAGYALTGDGSAVTLSAAAKYRISDPVAYALGFRNPQDALRGALASAVNETTVDSSVDGLLTTGKKVLADAVVARAQKTADRLGLGVTILSLEFRSIEPPMETRSAFDAVNEATVNHETAIKEAVQYREQIVPAANADAAQTIQDARVAAAGALAQARNDMAEFWGLLPQFKANPGVVTWRAWGDAMAELMPRLGVTYVLPGATGTPRLVLP